MTTNRITVWITSDRRRVEVIALPDLVHPEELSRRHSPPVSAVRRPILGGTGGNAATEPLHWSRGQEGKHPIGNDLGLFEEQTVRTHNGLHAHILPDRSDGREVACLSSSECAREFCDPLRSSSTHGCAVLWSSGIEE